MKKAHLKLLYFIPELQNCVQNKRFLSNLKFWGLNILISVFSMWTKLVGKELKRFNAKGNH